MKLGGITPIFRIFDVEKAKEFYLDFLGFQVDWEHRFAPDMPLYFSVTRDQCTIHLSEHFGDACPGSAIRVEIDDVDSYQQLLLQKMYKNARPGVHDKPWGTREMYIGDPFGNRLHFFTRIP